MNYHRPTNYYIWQKADWPNFKWDEGAVAPRLLSAKSSVAYLLGSLSVVEREEGQGLSLEAMTSNVVDSSLIEGQVLDSLSVRSSLANRLGVQLSHAVQPDHYTEGVVQATLDAVQNYALPLSAERLFGWHAALFPTGYSGTYRIRVGGWREGEEPMLLVSGAMGHERIHYEAPPSAQVADEMQRLLEWVETPSTTDALLRAAIAHLWFVAIHPFDDGNGRIARTLTDLMLCRNDQMPMRYYSVTTQMLAHRKDYYAALSSATTASSDITAWLLWFLQAVEAAVAASTDQLKTALVKRRFLAVHDLAPLNPRQRKVVECLLGQFEGLLTTAKYAKLCHCSHDTALRDLSDLMARGLVRRAEAGGRSTHYLLASAE